ncbi:hypothetical protein C8Q78DRAFT_1034588 [Trametes maxima]|nr:hypothetical protein C8Q78DRAFT_1034588 [Trametes maxima]
MRAGGPAPTRQHEIGLYGASPGAPQHAGLITDLVPLIPTDASGTCACASPLAPCEHQPTIFHCLRRPATAHRSQPPAARHPPSARGARNECGTLTTLWVMSFRHFYPVG